MHTCRKLTYLDTCEYEYLYVKKMQTKVKIKEWNHNTWSQLKLEKGRSRLDVRKHFFTQRVVNLWNARPVNFVSAPTVNAFLEPAR